MVGDDNLELLAGETADGEPVFEPVPATHLERNLFRLRATPGLAEGCAAGDVVAVGGAGRFRVVERGGNLGIHLEPPASLPDAGLASLRAAVAALGGEMAAAWHRRFVVVTVPAGAGLATVGRAMEDWCRTAGAGWYYTNVYGDDGEPLGWWGDEVLPPD